MVGKTKMNCFLGHKSEKVCGFETILGSRKKPESRVPLAAKLSSNPHARNAKVGLQVFQQITSGKSSAPQFTQHAISASHITVVHVRVAQHEH